MCPNPVMALILVFCVVLIPVAVAAHSSSEAETLTITSESTDAAAADTGQSMDISGGKAYGHYPTQLRRHPPRVASPYPYALWTPEEVFESVVILLFGALMFAVPTYLSVKLDLDWNRSSGLWLSLTLLILACSILLVISEYTSTQLAAGSCLIGAVVDYAAGGTIGARKPAHYPHDKFHQCWGQPLTDSSMARSGLRPAFDSLSKISLLAYRQGLPVRRSTREPIGTLRQVDGVISTKIPTLLPSGGESVSACKRAFSA